MTDKSLLRPEDVWGVDWEYQSLYDDSVRDGLEIAKSLDAAIVCIARNCMPALDNTLALIEVVQRQFRACKMFVFENDSTDGTDAVLDAFAERHEWATVEHGSFDRPDCRGFDRARTEALATYRNKCRDWVEENASRTAWTIVIDLDPQHGFSEAGVFNSIAWLSRKQSESSVIRPGGMASYSLYRITNEDGSTGIAQYDSWAARMNWWRDRREEVGMGWFSMFLPPVGSPPIPMNSAFGGLCVYDTAAFLSSRYSGEDCEHVPMHKRMKEAGYQMYLNPGCRYIAIWQ